MTDETARDFRSLTDAFRRVSASAELDQTLDAILDGANSLVGYDAAAVYVIEPSSRRPIGYRTRGYENQFDPSRMRVDEETTVGMVLATGRARLLTELSESDRLSGRASSRAILAAPLLGHGGRVVGAVYLESDSGSAYSSSSADRLNVFAAGVAGAIERDLFYRQTMEQRRLESEVMVARQVMAGLLPREVPQLEGFDVAAASRPCYEVGGDYYDIISLGHDRWGIAIADVAGKGVAAALLVAAMRASLYLMAGHEIALRGVLSRANRFLHVSAGNKFVTLFYAVMDLQIRRLIYVNAAHLPPVLVRADGTTELLKEAGVPLGPFDAPRYFEGFAKLDSGDVLVLYTDGITEAMNAANEDYGLQRLTEALTQARSQSAKDICHTILEDVDRFSDSHNADDQTLVVFKAT